MPFAPRPIVFATVNQWLTRFIDPHIVVLIDLQMVFIRNDFAIFSICHAKFFVTHFLFFSGQFLLPAVATFVVALCQPHTGDYAIYAISGAFIHCTDPQKCLEPYRDDAFPSLDVSIFLRLLSPFFFVSVSLVVIQ